MNRMTRSTIALRDAALSAKRQIASHSGMVAVLANVDLGTPTHAEPVEIRFDATGAATHYTDDSGESVKITPSPIAYGEDGSIHVMRDGACAICGELGYWLAEHDERVLVMREL